MKQFCAGALVATCVTAVALLAVRTPPTAEAQGPAGSAKAQATSILAGKLVGVDVWTQQPDQGSGNARLSLGRVEVYEHFIVVTTAEGVRSLFPHGWYANLQFRAD
jgi:hypothetical protein